MVIQWALVICSDMLLNLMHLSRALPVLRTPSCSICCCRIALHWRCRRGQHVTDCSQVEGLSAALEDT